MQNNKLTRFRRRTAIDALIGYASFHKTLVALPGGDEPMTAEELTQYFDGWKKMKGKLTSQLQRYGRRTADAHRHADSDAAKLVPRDFARRCLQLLVQANQSSKEDRQVYLAAVRSDLNQLIKPSQSRFSRATATHLDFLRTFEVLLNCAEFRRCVFICSYCECLFLWHREKRQCGCSNVVKQRRHRQVWTFDSQKRIRDEELREKLQRARAERAGKAYSPPERERRWSSPGRSLI